MNLDEKIERLLKKVDADKITAYAQSHIIEKNYIIYDSKNNVAVCTRCGQKHWIEKGEYSGLHNTKGICPECYADAVYKCKGKGRKNITEYFRMLYMFRRGKTAYAAELYCNADFRNFGKPIIRTEIHNFFEFDRNGSHRYEYAWKWPINKCIWEELRCVKLTRPSGTFWYYSLHDSIDIYENNLEDVFTKSDLKYLWIPELIQRLNAYQLVRYIKDGMKFPSIELLYKAGFKKLIEERLGGTGSKSINIRGKSLQEIFKLDMGHIHKLQSHNPYTAEIEVYKKLTDREKRLVAWPIIENIAHYYRGMEEWLKSIEKYTTLIRFSDYIMEQKEKGIINTIEHARLDWKDYVETAEKLGMDMRRNSMLFPENLKEAHDHVTKLYEIESNKERDIKIKSYAYIADYKADNLIVRTALSQRDLNKESSGLGHCVKTYGNKLAEGRCRIFFIRNKEDAETPFYTLETKPDGEFVQCRGKSNCSMTKEVETFVNEFIKELKKALKKEAKKCKITTQSAAQPAA